MLVGNGHDWSRFKLPTRNSGEGGLEVTVFNMGIIHNKLLQSIETNQTNALISRFVLTRSFYYVAIDPVKHEKDG